MTQRARGARVLPCALTLFAVCLVVVRGAFAEEAGLRAVEVRVEPGRCFDLRAIESLRSELSALRSEREMLVELSETEGVIVFRVTAAGTLLGARTIDTDGASCAEVQRGAVLAVSVALASFGSAAPESQAQVEPPPVQPESVLPEVPSAVPTKPVARPDTAPPEPSLVDHVTAPTLPDSKPSDRRLRAGTSLEVGAALALTGAASMVSSLTAEVAYAPRAELSPEVSGRGGLSVSLPSRSVADEREVWLSLYASRWDVCGGLLGRGYRVRVCGGTLLGALVGEGAESSGMVAIAGRLEGTWRATERVGLLLAGDALSILHPTSFTIPADEFQPAVIEDLSPISLAFSTGVIAEWL